MDALQRQVSEQKRRADEEAQRATSETKKAMHSADLVKRYEA